MVDQLEDAAGVQGDGGAVDGLAVGVVAHAEYLRLGGVVDVEREVVARHDPVQRRGDELAQRDLGGCDLAHELFHGVFLEGGGEGRYLGLEPVGELHDLEDLLEVVRHQFDDVREGEVLALVHVVRRRADDGVAVGAAVDGVRVVVRKEPREEVEVHLRGFVEEVEALGVASLVDVAEDEVGDLGCVGRVGNVGVVDGVAAVGLRRVVEVQHVKLGLHGVVFPQPLVLLLVVNFI